MSKNETFDFFFFILKTLAPVWASEIQLSKISYISGTNEHSLLVT